MTKTPALECAEKGIRINAICPGVIKTDMFAAIPSEVQRSLASQQSGKRLGLPEEVAEVVVWLCSPAASFLTGQAICIDGGSTAA